MDWHDHPKLQTVFAGLAGMPFLTITDTRLFPDDLHEHALAAVAVKFAVENLFPRAKSTARIEWEKPKFFPTTSIVSAQLPQCCQRQKPCAQQTASGGFGNG